MRVFQILPGNQGHHEAVYSLVRKEFPYLGKDLESFVARYAQNNYRLLVAECDGAFAGFVEAEILSPGKGRINGISVCAGYRGQGCATQLMEGMLSVLAKSGLREIQLLVKRQNAAAKRLYEKFGFEFLQVLAHPIDGERVEVYRLPVTILLSPIRAG